MVPFRTALRAAVVAIAGTIALSFSTVSYGDSYVASDFYLGSEYLETDIHKAVQAALKAKGFYSGPVDGEFGATSKRAVIKFRAANHISRKGALAMKLDKPLVKTLLGIPNLAVDGWEAQQCLMSKLGKLSEADSRDACP
jgi:hypothetical protein